MQIKKQKSKERAKAKVLAKERAKEKDQAVSTMDHNRIEVEIARMFPGMMEMIGPVIGQVSSLMMVGMKMIGVHFDWWQDDWSWSVDQGQSTPNSIIGTEEHWRQAPSFLA